MNLQITQLDFEFIVVEKLYLAHYPESAFRGAFGQELKQLACVAQQEKCTQCGRGDQCPYVQVFEPVMTGREANQSSKGFYTKPRPYIIEVKTNHQTDFLPGDTIRLQFRFFGEMRSFLPFIILAWQNVGKTGIGRDSGKFVISEIWQTNPLVGTSERIYSEYLSQVLNKELAMEFDQVQSIVEEMSKEEIRIKLISPMLLIAEGRTVKQLEFEMLIRNLFRRLSSLFVFYGDGKMELPFPQLLEQAKTIQRVKDTTRWENWSRFSNRQRQKVHMYGLVGEVCYRGDLAPFLPFLVFGQYCYIGKNTVFGEGNYKIIP